MGRSNARLASFACVLLLMGCGGHGVRRTPNDDLQELIEATVPEVPQPGDGSVNDPWGPWPPRSAAAPPTSPGASTDLKP